MLAWRVIPREGRATPISRNVSFFVYPGFVLLDLSGPLDALAIANRMVPGSYSVQVVSQHGGQVQSSSGLEVVTTKGTVRTLDTFVVVGAMTPEEWTLPARSMWLIRQLSGEARRTASVCTGAFLLAACGLLDGRRATTHWRYAPRLKLLYPSVRVDGDRIFLNDGGTWTSAGMTAGIDMVLALIEEDLGPEVTKAIARMMVVYYRRPGGQLQYSSLLELDPSSDRIRAALTFARDHIREHLTVELLAEVSHLSLRQFNRAFAESTGLTPAKAIERLRVEVARPRVEDSREPFSVIARSVGFADAERMCASFFRVLSKSPQELRRLARNEMKA